MSAEDWGYPALGRDPREQEIDRLRSIPDYEPTPSEGFPTFTLQQLRELPPPEWLIDRLIPEGLAVLYGQPGAYKSFLALDWALCVASGTPWNGREVERGCVLYVAAEGGGGLARRAEAWLEAHPEAPEPEIHFLPRSVDLASPDPEGDLAAMRDTLAQLPERPSLLVIDTMARAMLGGDENSARDVGRFIAALDGLDVGTRLVVHHAGKDGTSERGSSALRGAADMMARVEREDQAPTITLSCPKAPKDGEAWPSVTIRAEQLAGSLVLEPVSPFEGAARAAEERRERILTFVREHGPHGPVSRNKIEKGVGGNVALTREALDQLVIKREVIESRQRQAKLYSLPRPSLGDEVGTRSPRAPDDRPSSLGGEEDVVLPRGDEVESDLVPRPSSPAPANGSATCSDCGAHLTIFGDRLVCVGCEARGGAA